VTGIDNWVHSDSLIAEPPSYAEAWKTKSLTCHTQLPMAPFWTRFRIMLLCVYAISTSFG